MRHRRYRPILATTFTVVLAPCILWAGDGSIHRSPHAIKEEYIVVLNDDVAREDIPALARFLAQQHGGAVKRVWQDALKGFFVRMTEGQAQGWSHNPNVKYIEENAEMFLSTTVPTNVDPACTPAPGVSCTTTDNRLWHLDVIDQNAAVRTNDYSYCETGSGVYVYVIDTGVMRAHREFNNDATKVLNGYDATGDPAQFPAYDPCRGPGILNQPPDGQKNPSEVRAKSSHGTGVASLINGRNLGVAREAKIVPIKVRPCAQYGVRQLNPNTPNTFYGLNEVVYANSTHYKVVQGGNTGPAGTYPYSGWPQGTQWGDVRLEYMGPLPTEPTVQMTIEGLDWILRPVSQGGNPYPKSPAVVTLSTFRPVAEDGVTNTPTGSTLSLEDAIGNLLKYNNGQGITVIASANNQDANACDTSPGRMSRGNPTNPNNPDRPYKVITAGGTMLRNNPDANPARGGSSVDLPEPQYDPTRATRLARWRCWAGDSDNCSANIYSSPAPATPDPNDPNQPDDAYAAWTLGSNGGRCVSLFAPAKNIPVANLDDYNGYRNSRQSGGSASGTSWSAPIVAAITARILQSNPAYTVDNVYTELMKRTTPDLDPVELDPPNVTCPNDGQPCTTNKVLRLTPVVVQPLPVKTTAASSGNTLITINASGATGRTYELYQVNASFDVATYNTGAASSVKIAGPQSSNVFSVPSTAGFSYFARVRSSCGTGDTNITTITAPKDARVLSQSVPSTMVAGQSYAVSVTLKNVGNLTWSPVGPQCNAYRLGTANSNTWGVAGRGRVDLPAAVAPGQTVTLNFTVTAPSTRGIFNFQWRMVHECVGWFGDLTPNVPVTVKRAKDARFLSQSVPTTMIPGQSYPVSITLQNAGALAWSPVGPQCNAYRLGSANGNNWGVAGGGRVDLPAAVAPGQTVTLNFTVTAPSTPGTFNFQWRMVHECVGWFGDLSPNVAVNVAAPPRWEGYHDIATCRDIYGWAWDQNRPNTPINVNVYRDGAYTATISADIFRQDLLNAGNGNGYHGFDYVPDSSWRDGRWHSAAVRFTGTSLDLSWTPRSIICNACILCNGTPQDNLSTGGQVYSVATQFSSNRGGLITKLGFHRASGETGANTLRLWTDSGTLIASVTPSCGSSGWCWGTLSSPVTIAANTRYRVSVNTNTAQSKTGCGIGSGITNDPLTAHSGFWIEGNAFPTNGSCSNFFVDVMFDM